MDRPFEPDLSPEIPCLGFGILLSPAGETYLELEVFRFADPEYSCLLLLEFLDPPE